MLSGDTGLLTKAVESKEETRGGAVQEQRDLWVLEKNSGQYAKTQSAKSLSSLLQELGPNGQKLLTAEEIETINETGQVTIGSRTIVFKEILTIASEYDKGHIKIGDKLSYSANGVSDWIVFGKDNNGNVLLTTETPVGSFSPIYDVQHWLTIKRDLNISCQEYETQLQGKNIKARSITMEDINKVVGLTKPTLQTYKFTTDEDTEFSNCKINFYYPSEIAASSTYPYFQKATITSTSIEENSVDIPAKNFESNVYYYKYDSNTEKYKLSILESGSWKTEDVSLTNSQNFKYVVGENTQYLQYFVATTSVNISPYASNFCFGYVSNR